MADVQPVPTDEPIAEQKESSLDERVAPQEQFGSDSEAILKDMEQLSMDKTQRSSAADDVVVATSDNADDTITTTTTAEAAEAVAVRTTSKPTVIEDFIRNFLICHEMHDTLDIFQREWYTKLQTQRVNASDIDDEIPDIYIQKEKLERKVHTLQDNLGKMELVTEKVKTTWDNLRKERDFHRMHHRRVLQEKEDLMKQLKRLKTYCDSYEPLLNSLKLKYENAKKEKMLTRIDRDRMALKLQAMEQQPQLQQNSTSAAADKSVPIFKHKTDRKCLSKSSKFPTFSARPKMSNSDAAAASQVKVEKCSLHKTLSSLHEATISQIALHPTRDIICTASDDQSWKLWNVADGELIMTGHGHIDFVSSVSFDAKGAFLASGSGDGTVKIWDFAKSCCVVTFGDHTSVVWDVCYHSESCAHVVSCSMDHTMKLFDISRQKCVQTYRGHVDSVNAVQFQPHSNHIVSASSDKTVSFWDVRTAHCVQTLYGHSNSINCVRFNRACEEIITADSDACVKVFDIRMCKERVHVSTHNAQNGNAPSVINDVVFDPTEKLAIVAADDALIKVYDLQTGQMVASLPGHEGSVHGLLFAHGNNRLLSCSSDRTVRLWQ